MVEVAEIIPNSQKHGGLEHHKVAGMVRHWGCDSGYWCWVVKAEETRGRQGGLDKIRFLCCPFSHKDDQTIFSVDLMEVLENIENVSVDKNGRTQERKRNIIDKKTPVANIVPCDRHSSH